jgi:hypothetical protein
MKTLEQEAEEYSAQFGPVNHHERVPSFIAGVNSKYVQVEKINAQIELLYQARIAPITWFDQKVEELEQRLKELEDENNTIQT